ncbi:polysaccharide lyase family 8 super-sandwich domain-containing protein [Paraflavisolibacter sp. H34]|uniref:polysaccharide lyase family 8 super-sandwich domain-containing protein n=1 Tax=Huijunlia imazamoxiresistens TaxID=3127457 RepID=UPI003018CD32
MAILKKVTRACFLTGMTLLSHSSFSQTFPFDTIMNRINADVHAAGGSVSGLDSRVASAQATLIQNDSAWADVNYTTGDGNHLVRLLDCARAYTRSSSTYYGDTALYNRVVKALWYWYRKNPVHPNWYFNEIAYPQDLGRILIALRYGKPGLPAGIESLLVERMAKGNPYAQTGANKTDIALHFLFRSCLLQRPALLDSAAQQSFEPVKQVSSGEGLQYDNSYFQHGNQLMISSYGGVFLNNAYTAAGYLKGTPYELSAANLELLSRFAQWTHNNAIRGRYFDFSCTGRAISRLNGLQPGNYSVKQRFADPANTAAWDASNARLTLKQPASYQVAPLHLHYWRGDYDLHQRPGYLFTVRTNSTRTYRTERGNNENILGKFLPDGGTAILRTGNEYFNIFPVWEWDKVPGVTARDFAADQPITVDWGEPGTTGFVGGVGDSLYGASVYDQNYNGVKAKKSWFYFDNEVVCLGAGISSTQPETVTTSLNQSWLSGNVYTSQGGTVTARDANTVSSLAAPQWVWHDSTGYFFPSGGNIVLSNREQSGSWYQINQSQPANTVTGKVFKLWFDQGVQPVNGKYAYIVAPGLANVAAMQQYPVHHLKIVANSDSVQAVRHLQLNQMQVVFHKAGTLTDDSVTVSVDKPCILLLRQLDANQVVAYVADPAQTQTAVTLSLETPATRGKKYIVVSLPQSPYSGSAAKVIFDRNSPGKIIPVLPPSAPVVADAYVRDGASAATNFGTVTSLPVKADAAGFSREAYFKFDFREARGKVDTALLRLYCNGGNTTAGTTQWNLYRVQDNSWTETGLNWNNRPLAGSLAASRQGQSTAGYVEWNISSLMDSIPSDSLLSFRLVSTLLGSTTDANFASRETADVSRRPVVLLKYNKPPTVTLSAPANNEVVEAGSTLTLRADAADEDGGVSRVEFYQDTVLIGADLSAPFSLGWQGAAPGQYELYAKAYDHKNSWAVSSLVTVTVNAAPTVRLLAPASSDTVLEHSNLSLVAEASDATGTIARVDFYRNGIKAGEAPNAPYQFAWKDVAPGTYLLKAVAVDQYGKAGTSEEVTLLVRDTTAPRFTFPGNSLPDIHLGACTATAAWAVPGATDNCPGVTVQQTGGPEPGATFAPGSTTVIRYTATDASGNRQTCSFTISRDAEVMLTTSNSNPQLYFGYTEDQTAVLTAAGSGGKAPYTVSIGMNRALISDYKNEAGDENWTSTAGLFQAGATVQSSMTQAAAGSPLSVQATLLAPAEITATVTDANGCTASATTAIKAEDVRCFAGSQVKVALCHVTGNEKKPFVALCVDSAAVNDHLRHGDNLGNCAPASVKGALDGEPAAGEAFTLQAYPNPSRGAFTLRLQAQPAAPVRVTVYDRNGRRVLQQQVAAQTIRLGETLPAGLYLVEAVQNNLRKTVVVVKQ